MEFLKNIGGEIARTLDSSQTEDDGTKSGNPEDIKSEIDGLNEHKVTNDCI